MLRTSPSLPAAGIAAEKKASGPDKVKVWPELVMREGIAALAAVIGLGLLSIFIDAPLEILADPSFSMNPSKAPWYFLGLQELLVYFSPWIAGVFIPTTIVLGLMTFPYLDPEPAGNTSGRGISILFTAGMVLWISLTVIGLFFRGPNWAWQLPWQTTAPVASSHIAMEWFFPLFLLCYLAYVILRRAQVKEEIKSLGAWKYLILHGLILTGVAVTSKIVLFTILGLGLR